MKSKSLLVFSIVAAAIVVGCSKENASNYTKFTGIEVEVGENEGVNRLLVLNEGAYPSSSVLDLLDFKSKTYSADVFGQANPDITQGIGNTGNDIALIGDKIWALMNASNQVVVMDKYTLKVDKILDVDSPRFIATDGSYAYITSFGSAVYGAAKSEDGYLYRIRLSDYYSTRVAVGPQPEGVAVHGDKVYVANSGGYNATKDNRIFVFDISSGAQLKTIELPVANLKNIFAGDDKLWVTTYDIYAADYSIEALAQLCSVNYDGTGAEVIAMSPTYAAQFGDTVYIFCYGMVSTLSLKTGKIDTDFLKDTSLENAMIGGLAVNPVTGDMMVSDAKYTGNSSVICVDKDLKDKWKVETGVGAGHLLLY